MPPQGQYFKNYSHGENITNLDKTRQLISFSGFDFIANYPNQNHNFDIYL